jgi:hypothetical protein
VAASSSFSSGARAQVHGILSKPPYTKAPAHTPRPLAGVLHALGRALNAAIGGPARWLYHHVLLHLGHGFRAAFGGWWEIVAAALAAAVGVTAAVLITRRRARVSSRTQASRKPVGVDEDPDELEGRAGVAEAAGDHETAVRLRFRAGLVRLQRAGIVANPGSRTDRQLSAVLGSRTFDALAGRHEAIVYAGDLATAADSATARDQWPRVHADAGSNRS